MCNKSLRSPSSALANKRRSLLRYRASLPELPQATNRDLKQIERIDRSNAPQATARDLATKQEIQDLVRDERQTNQYAALLERMKNAGCITPTEK